MSRREDEEGIRVLPGYKEADYPYIPLKIAGSVEAIVGDFEITNIDIFALYGKTRVTEVPAGGRFEIHAKYRIQNLNPGWFLISDWTTCMTVWDVTRNKTVGYDPDNHTGGGILTAEDAVNVVMPISATTFRVKIFAVQLAFAGAPPELLWK